MPLNSMQDFRRDISYRCLKREDGTILLTGTISDRFHDIVAEIVVDGKNLDILSAGAEFRRSPTEDCRCISDRMQRLAGFTIGKGLNRKLTEVFAGGDGCGNMKNLLLGLLPLAMNVRASEGFSSDEEMLDAIHEGLRGACAGYANPAGSVRKNTAKLEP